MHLLIDSLILLIVYNYIDYIDTLITLIVYKHNKHILYHICRVQPVQAQRGRTMNLCRTCDPCAQAHRRPAPVQDETRREAPPRCCFGLSGEIGGPGHPPRFLKRDPPRSCPVDRSALLPPETIRNLPLHRLDAAKYVSIVSPTCILRAQSCQSQASDHRIPPASA